MAPQKIRAPRAAALGLQKFFLRPAEFAQTRKAGNYNPFFRFARRAWIAGDDSANPLRVNLAVRNLLIPGKPCVIKKLPRHAREGKTAVGIIRWRLAPAKSHFTSGRVMIISPNQFVYEGE